MFKSKTKQKYKPFTAANVSYADDKRRYRKISQPKLHQGVDRYTKNPFDNEFITGEFENDIYSVIRPRTYAKVYITSILKSGFPTILLFTFFIILEAVFRITMGESLELHKTPGGIQLTLITVAISAFFVIRKIKDHMAYFHVELSADKHELNRLTLERLEAGDSPLFNREIAVMMKHRRLYNKYILFPSRRELASENQRYSKIMNSVHTNEHMIDFVMNRRDQLSAIQREQEHEAARKIALMLEPDAKHNSYDLAVAKYKRRTTHNMRLIIQNVLNKKLKVIETKSIL